VEEDLPEPRSGMIKVGSQVFEIIVEDEAGNAIRSFKEPLKLTFIYDPDALPDNVSEASIHVFYFDEQLGEWIVVPSDRDPETGVITAYVDHLTLFALFYAPEIVLPTDLDEHWSQSDVLKLISLGIV